MERVKSLFISLVLYFGVGLMIAELLFVTTDRLLYNAILKQINPNPSHVEYNNGIINTYFEDESEIDVIYNFSVDEWFNIIWKIREITPFILFGLSVFITAFLFYRRKLKKDFDMLQNGIQKIQHRDLEFEIRSKSKNELGQLCNSFEIMRNELRKNYVELLNEKESQENLFRSFSHDLRTPLTIIKGNNDVLRCLIEHNEKHKEIASILDGTESAVSRISMYTEMLKNIRALEQWELHYSNTNLKHYLKIVEEQAIQLGKRFCREFELSFEVESFIFDNMLVQLVIDRILENAFRFSKEKVKLKVTEASGVLRFLVVDDGAGFTPEGKKKAKNIFYSTDKSRGHLGVGLYFAELLLEQHESTLHIDNTDQGAEVYFDVKCEIFV